MRTGRRKLAFVLGPPVLCMGLLAGMVGEQRHHLTPEDAEPYHARAKAAVDAVPYIIGDWTGENNEVPQAAQKLLRPNVILSRRYSDNAAGTSHRARSAQLLIVQCYDSRDMLGHYPPICYRAQGMVQEAKNSGPRDWKVGNTTIGGTEYQFSKFEKDGHLAFTTVYNFLIVPGKGIVRDMKGVEQAAEDYQQRYFGAAQFQVVFHGTESASARQERDEIFAALIGPNLKLLETLTSGVLK